VRAQIHVAYGQYEFQSELLLAEHSHGRDFSEKLTEGADSASALVARSPKSEISSVRAHELIGALANPGLMRNPTAL
jgi:hypothetical protein